MRRSTRSSSADSLGARGGGGCETESVDAGDDAAGGDAGIDVADGDIDADGMAAAVAGAAVEGFVALELVLAGWLAEAAAADAEHMASAASRLSCICASMAAAAAVRSAGGAAMARSTLITLSAPSVASSWSPQIRVQENQDYTQTTALTQRNEQFIPGDVNRWRIEERAQNVGYL